MDGKTSSSALKALSSHASQDTSRQRDRFAPGPSSSSSGFRTFPGSSSRQQLQQPSPQQQPEEQAFNLSPLQHALPHNHHAHVHHHPSPSQWQQDFHSQVSHPQGPAPGGNLEAQWARAAQPGPAGSSQWASSFHQSPQGPIVAQPGSSFQQPAYQPSYGMGMDMSMMGGGGMGMYGLQNQQQPAQQQVESQSKGKAQADKAWETAFGAFDQKETEGETKDQDVKGKGKEKEAINEDFERAWNATHQEPAEHSGTHMGVGQDDLASWESQFSQFANGKGESAEEAYKEMLAEQEARMPDEASVMEGLQGSVDERGWPRLGQYTFESSNPYALNPTLLSSFDPSSSLSDRALHLEATLQQSSTSQIVNHRLQLDEARTWLELGDIQTQDEKELAGMRALEAAKKAFEGLLGREGMGGLSESEMMEAREGMGRTLISLAVSYTNESYDEAAYLSLHQHLSLLHPAAARPLPQTDGGTISNPWEVHGLLTQSYLEVVRGEMQEGRVVPESQMALGLLNYSQGEFERSADCWGAALSVKPDDFLLWNRLGATLANGGKPEEAIDAYRRALELNPTFTRAVYNLGVSCLNIGIFKEAAEHLLSALSLHERSSMSDQSTRAGGLTNRNEAVNQSLNLWATLRRAFYSMDRPDLAEKAVVGADLALFRGEFEF